MIFVDKDKYYKLKGVYIIKNIINNKVYVGSTFNKFSDRFIIHKSRLKRNVHHSPHLQNSWNKYGAESFEFIVLEVLTQDSIIVTQEEYWINYYNAILEGYNVTALIEGKRFKKHSEETKAKMSKNRYKKVCSYDLDGNYIKTYDSINNTELDGFNPKCVSTCCNDENISHKNIMWKFYNENNFQLKILPYTKKPHPPSVKVLDLLTGEITLGIKNAALKANVSYKAATWDLGHLNRRFKKVKE